MRPLAAIRHATPFDKDFLLRGPLFRPLTRAATALGCQDDFPPVEDLGRVFDGPAPVRFVEAAPHRRGGRRGPLEASALYDAQIALGRVVPTRARCWHDFMNALVWGTFPRAKLAMHVRQHRAISERLAPGTRQLPPTRTRELDALALLDEGGVALLAREPEAATLALQTRTPEVLRELARRGAVEVIVFGHAIYESLALGVQPAVVAAIVLARAEPCEDFCRQADEALANAIADPARLLTPGELKRVDLRELPAS
jgi:hypothetical protein